MYVRLIRDIQYAESCVPAILLILSLLKTNFPFYVTVMDSRLLADSP